MLWQSICPRYSKIVQEDPIRTVFAEDAIKKLILSERKNKAKLWANICEKTYDYKCNHTKDYVMAKELENYGKRIT